MGIAFFDMDKTLLSKSSGTLYVKYLWRRGMISVSEMVGVMVISLQYSLNLLNFPNAMARLSNRIRGGDAAATKQLCDRWVEEDVLQYIAPKALERLRAHERRGDYVVLISASTQFAVEPVARHLGIPYRCTELEVVNGKFTGRIVGEPCYGDGRARHTAERLHLLYGFVFRPRPAGRGRPSGRRQPRPDAAALRPATRLADRVFLLKASHRLRPFLARLQSRQPSNAQPCQERR